MRDFELLFEDGKLSVDWSAAVTGIHSVKQKLINNFLTDRATDEVVASRGTTLLRTVAGGGAYDLRSTQHALNFAALSSKLAVRSHEAEDAAPLDRVRDFTAVFSSLSGATLLVDLALTTADGNSIGVRQPLS